MTNQLFRSLHQGPTPLLLPNVWDAGSARLMESLGAKAIATTSAGLCWSRGYADDAGLPVDILLAATREIVRVISVPLSVDIEAGYSDDPPAVAELVTRLIDSGIAGINIEDGTAPPDLLCRKIEAIRRTAGDLYINVRTDVYLRGFATGQAAVEEVIRRARLYCAAGCDGLFVPGLADVDGMQAIASAIDPAPLNIMLVPGLPAIDVLYRHCVRRFSAGSAIAQAALGHARHLATRFLAGSTEELLASTAVEYGAMNRLF